MKRFVLVAVALVFAVGGCSGDGRRPTYPVAGTVTLKGQPLEGATVVFVPAAPLGEASHEPASGITDAAGKFKLSTFLADDGAQEGEYQIKVSKFNIKKPTKEEQDKYISMEEEQKIQFGDEKPTPPAKNTLSPKYADETKSGFTYTVKKGQDNKVDLKLE